ncbi:flagellar basal-body rod protein FlgB [Breoghania corrubedonensis]|uniref:Flagellar basal-body rod protein FlgB n=1 Tax=Breoghania corrubedonensis TaxID=665038 RepID=A0A2T5V8Q8_9HYPH|nr:flagellar basal body rod protein FlgB [Breoghania corrubedonensis]PTW60145.1 flagellar basal-body rod protein FlgB [Breoghania corrubedonensis]
MEPVYLFSLASQRNEWLSVRQAAISENIANANTPGYGAKDVTPFTAVFDDMAMPMIATHDGHMGGAAATSESTEVKKGETWQVSYSGNSVSLEQEMVKATEVGEMHALTTSILKSFHQMILTSVKG